MKVGNARQTPTGSLQWLHRSAACIHPFTIDIGALIDRRSLCNAVEFRASCKSLRAGKGSFRGSIPIQVGVRANEIEFVFVSDVARILGTTSRLVLQKRKWRSEERRVGKECRL